MRKVITLCLLALSLFNLYALSESDKEISDSTTSSLFGRYQANGFLKYYNSLPDVDRAKISKDDLLRGYRDIMLSDTTNQGYHIGMSMGIEMLDHIMQIERLSDVRIDINNVVKSMDDALVKDELSDEEMENMKEEINRVELWLSQKKDEYRERQILSDPEVQKTISAGEDFIASRVKADKSIKQAPSGWYYKINKTGQGDKVVADKDVKLNYSGISIDGTVFDNSENVVVNPNGLIPGLIEGLMMMRKGDCYTFYIPGKLAYGSQGIPDIIKPMETLVFEVEVLDIVEREDTDDGVVWLEELNLVPVE